MFNLQKIQYMLYTIALTPLAFLNRAFAEDGDDWADDGPVGELCVEGQCCPSETVVCTPEGGALIALIAVPVVVTIVLMLVLSKHFGTKAVEAGVTNVQSHARSGLGLGAFLGSLTYIGTLVALAGGIPGSQLILVIALGVVGLVLFGATWAGRK